MAKVTFNYTHFDLKAQPAGMIVEVTLASVANVRLMTDTQFKLYKRTEKHSFIGGVARKSPIRLTIPQAEHWHLIVDMEGHHGEPKASIRVFESQTQPRFKTAS